MKVRQLEKKDNSLLAKWLSDPTALEFYEGRNNPFSIEKVNCVFYKSDRGQVRCIIDYEGSEIGYIQFYLLDEETKKEYGYSQEETIYGTDQFIGESEYWNKGVGTLLVSSMVQFLIEQKKADRVVMDPQVRNVRAIKCYEKCGFKKVKMLLKQELHEGVLQDCWLIEYHNK